jgi:hypothetical protein
MQTHAHSLSLFVLMAWSHQGFWVFGPTHGTVRQLSRSAVLALAPQLFFTGAAPSGLLQS